MKEILLNKEVKIISSDRTGGVSGGAYKSLNLGLHVGDNPLNVEKNREIFASYFGANAKELCFMEQIHGSFVAAAKKDDTPKADALITQDKSLILCVMSADCAPVILYDSDKKAVAAIHAGRKGAFLDIITAAILSMKRDFKSETENMQAFIGPSIKSCCYEIEGEVLKEAMTRFSSALQEREGRWFLDLQKIIIAQLIANGVTNITADNTCTCCDKNYFSYRRDGICGRNVTGVKIL
jgi:YfiH family protein